MDLVLLFKLVHVLSAVVAVGANITYGPLLRLAGRDQDKLVFTLESVSWIDSRIANPAYILLAVSGVGMVFFGPFRFEQGWIALSIVLYIALAAIGIAVFAPSMRRQLKEARTDARSDTYAAAERRTNTVGLVTTAVALVIIALMVVKPF
jgi:uncharacterized membrane protein